MLFRSVFKVANIQRCLDCRQKCLREVVRVPSWVWGERPWVVVRPFWLLSLLSGRWARVSSPPPLAQMTARCYRSRTSSRWVDGAVVLWCWVGRRKAACLVVESCKLGRKQRAQRQRGRLSRTVQSRTAEKGKVNRWEGEADVDSVNVFCLLHKILHTYTDRRSSLVRDLERFL